MPVNLLQDERQVRLGAADYVPAWTEYTLYFLFAYHSGLHDLYHTPGEAHSLMLALLSSIPGNGMRMVILVTEHCLGSAHPASAVSFLAGLCL